MWCICYECTEMVFSMKASLNMLELFAYTQRQLDTFFPDNASNYKCVPKITDHSNSIEEEVHDRMRYCFSHVRDRAYSIDGRTVCFNHLHSDQYAVYLYFLANSLWKSDAEKDLCDKLLVLNRILHGFFLSYKCRMPDIFLLGHPVGTVIGNAAYSDYLYVLQNVTIETRAEDAPPLGKGLLLCSGAKIIGSGKIGDNVSVGVDGVIYKRDIPSNTIVIRDSGGVITYKENNTNNIETYFRVF